MVWFLDFGEIDRGLFRHKLQAVKEQNQRSAEWDRILSRGSIIWVTVTGNLPAWGNVQGQCSNCLRSASSSLLRGVATLGNVTRVFAILLRFDYFNTFDLIAASDSIDDIHAFNYLTDV